MDSLSPIPSLGCPIIVLEQMPYVMAISEMLGIFSHSILFEIENHIESEN